jgi:hypothetical protein
MAASPCPALLAYLRRVSIFCAHSHITHSRGERRKSRTITATLLFLGLALGAAFAEESWLNRPQQKVRFEFSTELGFLSVVSHTIQFGQSGTEFDYVADGGQDVYFPFKRISTEVAFGPRHKLVMLYQPITRTETQPPAPVYTETFAAGTPIELRYDRLHRISYLYDFETAQRLAAGISPLVRDVVVVFAARTVQPR